MKNHQYTITKYCKTETSCTGIDNWIHSTNLVQIFLLTARSYANKCCGLSQLTR